MDNIECEHGFLRIEEWTIDGNVHRAKWCGKCGDEVFHSVNGRVI